MSGTADTIGWDDFMRVQLCAGTVQKVEPFPEARKPAWKVWVDFGPHGVKKTSAQIRSLYAPDDLVGRQIVGVINFPPKQVGPFISEFLLTGFHTDEGVVVTTVERAGARRHAHGLNALT
ncbi:tRNA-binding protein [Pseudoxanthomonas japonensis]|uniref:tRNA-binding protein n=1 Tax=Pseudoxanthomonas japonensis TaxID=69284 RepID=UPI00286046C6|nr:tRNA-binding protein [Pseudoxanthomonas japonensis]MDR7070558.1 tRNA-binding protein [Pseudoxanthomonas japonensis]